MELYRNATPSGCRVSPPRPSRRTLEAAERGLTPTELGLLVPESCPRRNPGGIGEGQFGKESSVLGPTGHPESAPLSHSLVPSGWEESLGTEAVLPCPVLHGVVRRCPGPGLDAVPTPHPALLLRHSSGPAGHLRLCGGLLPGPGDCAAAWHRHVSPRRMPL